MHLPPDNDSLNLQKLCANYLAYVQRHAELRNHPSPIGHGWEMMNGHSKPVRYTKLDLRQYFHHTQAENKWVTALIQSASHNYLNQILTDDNCCCYKDHSCDVLDAIARDTDSCNVFYKKLNCTHV